MPGGGQTSDGQRSRRFVWPFVALLLCALAAVAATADLGAIAGAPALFAALAASRVFLDAVRIDVFERAKFTPTVPAVALACLFGPAGPIAAELISTVPRLLRAPPVRAAF